MKSLIEPGRFVRHRMLMGTGFLGLLLLPVTGESPRIHAEAQRPVQTILVPDPVDFAAASSLRVADAQPLIPPAPSRDIPASQPIMIPPLPQATHRKNSEPSPRKLPPSPQVPRRALPSVSNPAESANSEWTISITPMEKGDQPKLSDRYQAIYQSIPFRRSEYLANPSYRHDTTVEILFGQMRQTVIHRHDTPQRVVNPRPQLTQPYPLSKGELYSYWPLLQYGNPLPLLSPIQ